MDPVRSWASRPLIADASVWINIIAGGRAEAFIAALGEPLLIPRIAFEELERGREKGRQTAACLVPFIEGGVVTILDLPEEAEQIYLSLVAGPVRQTLDDGEAASLATALQLGGTAVIDERKAVAISADRFPDLPVVSTTDLFLSRQVRAIFPESEIADLLFGALTHARMRVPDQLLDMVCDILGPERTTSCTSLPARVRTAIA